MTGKFKDYNNAFGIFVGIVLMFAISIIGINIAIKVNNGGFLVFPIGLLAISSYFIYIPLGFGSFNADDDKLVLRVGLIKHTYSYSKIKSAEVQTGFTHGRYGSSAYVEFVITLIDGETATFCDNDVPDDALSTPEKHKEFHENHQFTKLSNYINQRAGR